MRFVAIAVLVAVVLAGCAQPTVPAFLRSGVSDWSDDVEDSMAPDFTGMGQSYPVLLLHQHHVASERQREARSNVVCSTKDGEPLVPLFPARRMDAAATTICRGPPADAATGRVYMERAEFDARGADAVLALMDPCAGGLLFLRAGEEIDVNAPGHAFRLRYHENATFSVDDRWIEPGTAVKISYYIAKGDKMDEEFVRVVFDHPGQWLESRVAPYDPEIDGKLPPRPDLGTGLAVEVPATAASVADPLRATLAATPGEVRALEALRVVHDGERLTEITIRYATATGTVTWYGAGRVDDAVRLLGAEGPATGEVGVAVDAFEATFDMPWSALRAGATGPMTDVRLDTTTAWSTAGRAHAAIDPALHPEGCRDGCVLARTDVPLQGAQWRMLLAPEKAGTEGALSLQVLAFDLEKEEVVWWHAPPSATAPIGAG